MTQLAVQVAADHAIALVGRIREAWAWLADTAEPGPARYVERHLSDTARVRLDQLVAAERSERVALQRDGLTPTPPTAAPARIGVLDARENVRQGVEDVAWRLSSALRLEPGTTYHRTGRTSDERLYATLDYLAATLLLAVDENLVHDLAARLEACDQAARAAAGVGADRRSLKTECPACGRRSLVADVGSPRPAEWAISCSRPGCRCRGVDCGCNRPTRYPGARHIWPEREWEQLATLLARYDRLAA